jgi:hypothetical protein
MRLFYIGLPDREDNRELIVCKNEEHALERAEKEFGYQALPVEIEELTEVEGYQIKVVNPNKKDDVNEPKQKASEDTKKRNKKG